MTIILLVIIPCLEHICQTNKIPHVHVQLNLVPTPSPWQPLIYFLSTWICFFRAFYTMELYSMWSSASDLLYLEKYFEDLFML